MEISDVVKEWWRYAEMDLATATRMLAHHPVPLEIIAYHCQQAAEKFLKSFLVYNNQDVPKTHDIVEICSKCSVIYGDFMELYEQCKKLNPYAISTRYPSGLQLADYHIKEALECAEEIKEFVLKAITPLN